MILACALPREGTISTNTPCSTNLSTFFFIVSLSERGIRKYLTHNGCSPFLFERNGRPSVFASFPLKSLNVRAYYG